MRIISHTSAIQLPWSGCAAPATTKDIEASMFLGSSAGTLNDFDRITKLDSIQPRKIDIKHLRFVIDDMPADVGISLSARHYWQMTRRLVKHIDEEFGEVRSEVDKVLYPFGGSEASLPFSIFPNANVVFVIDRIPFIKYADALSGKDYIECYSDPRHAQYRNYSDVETDQFLAARAIPSVLSLTAACRILRIAVFTKNNQSALFGEMEVNAVLYFDKGDGIIRKIVFLNKIIKGANSRFFEEDSFFCQDMHSLNRGALVVKGSQHMLRGGICNQTEREKIIQWLFMNRGLLIEDLFEGKYDFSGPNEFSNIPAKEIEDIPFGYGRKVKVTVFDPLRSERVQG